MAIHIFGLSQEFQFEPTASRSWAYLKFLSAYPEQWALFWHDPNQDLWSWITFTITHLRGVLKTRNGENYFHLGFKHAGIKGSRSRWVHSEEGFITSFNAPRSEWSHKKRTSVFKWPLIWWEQNRFSCCTLPQGKMKYKRNPLLRLFIKKLTLKRMNSNINLTIK